MSERAEGRESGKHSVAESSGEKGGGRDEDAGHLPPPRRAC